MPKDKAKDKSRRKALGNLAAQLSLYPAEAVVVDSNLFILFLVGLFDPREVRLCDKTDQYGINQFEFLIKVLASFRRIIITQPVLTEATNHLNDFNSIHHTVFYNQILPNLLGFEDSFISTDEILNGTGFAKLGFADSSLELLSHKYVVLTDDEPLYGHIKSQEGRVVFWRELNPSNY